jgi:hypothetical protein
MRGLTRFSITRRWKNADAGGVHASRFGTNGSDGLGILDAAAIEKVEKRSVAEATNADELHDALMLLARDDA